MEKDSFTFYRSFKEAIDLCPEDARLKIYEAIAEYALTEQEPTMAEPYAKLCWKLIKPQLDANWRRYKNGQAGGAPKGNRNAVKQADWNNRETTNEQPTYNRETTNGQPNININIKDNIKEKHKEKEGISATATVAPAHSRFTPPSKEEVEAYCEERGNKINAQHFFDFYEANGWVQGKQGKPLKDWKAAVRTWECNGINYKTNNDGRQHTTTPTGGFGEVRTDTPAKKPRHTTL